MRSTLTSIAACSLLAAVAAAQPQPRYTVTDLGTLGGTYSFPFGINDAGKVAGGAATPAQTDFVSTTAFLWTRQKGMTNLGTLGPPAFPACPTCNSGAAAVGAAGEVAVGSEIATMDPNGEDFCEYGTHHECRGAIWRNGVLTALPVLPGGNNANVFWMNNLGQSSGFSENGVRRFELCPRDALSATPLSTGDLGAARRDSEGSLSARSEGRHRRIRLYDQRQRRDRRSVGFVLDHRFAACRHQFDRSHPCRPVESGWLRRRPR